VHAVAGLIALNAAFLGCGYGLLRMLGRRLAFADAGLAFCAGVAALVGACSLLAVAGYVPGVPVACGLAVVGAAPALLAIRRSMFRLPRGGAVAWLRLDIVSTAVVAAAACTYAVATLVVSSVKFLDEWDAWSMWTLKAKGLVVFGSLSTADFAGSAHPDYPIFVPMLQSLTFRFMGSFDTKLVHVEHALLAIAFAGAATRLLSGRLPRPALVAIGLVLLAAPGVARNVPDALADVPVAVFVALAGLTLALWLTYDAPTLGLFVLFAAAAAWTMDEGLASVAAICVAALPLAARSPTKRRLGRFAAAVGGVALLYLPWHFWKAAHGAVYDTSLTQGVSLHFFSERGHAAVRALHAMWSQLGDLSLWD
jgi:hypothetical protein